MKTLFVAGLLAFLGALLITGLYRPKPLESQLLHLQVEQAMPEWASRLEAESPEIQALFLAYAQDPVLLAKARLALLRYPDMARPIFALFGDSEEFLDVLRTYGEDVVLPIHYFLTHEVFTLELMRGASETARSALNAIRRLWDEPGADSPGTRNALSSEDRGRYAVQFIKAEGYGFLGQFVLNAKGEVGWVQTERVLEGINSFFAGGVRELEARLRRDEAITAGDVGWATADVAIGVGALKVLRMGRTAGTGARAMSFSERSAALGAGLWRGSAIGAGLVKYGAPAVLAYVALRHPSVINSLIGSVAEKIGLRVELAQVLGWTMVLLPVLLLLRLLLGPLVWLLAAITALFRGLHGLLGDRSGRASYRSQ